MTKSTTPSLRLRLLLWVLAALPAVIPLWLICHFAVEFHFWDEWDPGIAGLYIKAHDYALTFADLFRQHNEHRILLPRLAYLALTALSHWNAKWEMIAQWLIVCATSLGILRLMSRSHRLSNQTDNLSHSRRPFLVLILWLACNLLIFTPAAWENWLRAMGLANVMPMAFVTATLVVVSSRMKLWTKTIAGIVLSILATYSSGNGMLAWPLAGMVLARPWDRSDWTAQRAPLATWALAAGVVVATYFIGYTRPEHRGLNSYATGTLPILHYTLVFLGLTFAHATSLAPLTNATIAASIELILLAITIICFARRPKSAGAMVVWFAVAGFAILSALIAAAGRAGLGVEQAIISSRYVTYSLYLPVALINLIALMLSVSDSRIRIARLFASGLLVVMAIGIGYSSIAAMVDCRAEQQSGLQGKAAVLLVRVLPTNPAIAAIVFPDSFVVLREAKIFDDLGCIRPRLLRSSDARRIEVTDPDKIAGARGNFDRVDETSRGRFIVVGWAAFTKKSAPADAIFLTYDDNYGQSIIFSFAQIGASRPDVARVLHSDDFDASGWIGQFTRAMLPANQHNITISAWAMDSDTGLAFKLDGQTTIP